MAPEVEGTDVMGAIAVVLLALFTGWKCGRYHEKYRTQPYVYRTENGIVIRSASQEGLDDALAAFGVGPDSAPV